MPSRQFVSLCPLISSTARLTTRSCQKNGGPRNPIVGRQLLKPGVNFRPDGRCGPDFEDGDCKYSTCCTTKGYCSNDTQHCLPVSSHLRSRSTPPRITLHHLTRHHSLLRAMIYLSRSSAMALTSAFLSPRTVLAAQPTMVPHAAFGVEAGAAACMGSAATPTLTVAKAANLDRVSNLQRFQYLPRDQRR